MVLEIRVHIWNWLFVTFQVIQIGDILLSGGPQTIGTVLFWKAVTFVCYPFIWSFVIRLVLVALFSSTVH